MSLKMIEVTENEARILNVLRDAAKIQKEGKMQATIDVFNGKMTAPDSAKMLDDLKMTANLARW